MVHVNLNKGLIFGMSSYLLEQWGGPWVVRRDFNVIRFTHEKNQPSTINRSMRDFNILINQCDLRDSPLLNVRFTWTDGKDNPLLSRLDRFLVSNSWEEVYPHFFQEAILKIVSDHWPIMINTSKVNYGLIPFQFEYMWVSHPHFKDHIQGWWCEFAVEGYKGFRFMKKLQNIKHKLRVWNRDTFGLIKEKKDSLWNEMSYLDRKLEEDGCLSPLLKDRKNQILGEMESILRREDTFWSQKAKCKWLKDGDGNTK